MSERYKPPTRFDWLMCIAAGYLPEGARIRITVESGCGSIELLMDGEVIDSMYPSDEPNGEAAIVGLIRQAREKTKG